jgi:transcriptional regulator with XRE-family HTH domain
VNLSTPKVEYCELCRYAEKSRSDIVFYDKFMYLCNKKGVAPSRAAMDAGISKSLVTKWKSNRTQVPSPEILQKLSAYFSVPVSVLLSEEEMPIVSDAQKETPDQLVLTGVDKELYELLMQIPEEQKKLFLEMGRAFVNNLNKG